MKISHKTTVSFTLQDIVELIKKELNVSDVVCDVRLQDVSDDRFGMAPQYELSSIEATITPDDVIQKTYSNYNSLATQIASVESDTRPMGDK